MIHLAKIGISSHTLHFTFINRHFQITFLLFEMEILEISLNFKFMKFDLILLSKVSCSCCFNLEDYTHLTAYIYQWFGFVLNLICCLRSSRFCLNVESFIFIFAYCFNLWMMNSFLDYLPWLSAAACYLETAYMKRILSWY